MTNSPTAAIRSATSGPTEPPEEGVVSAFVLGWHVTELFHANVPNTPRSRTTTPRNKLPGLSDLDSMAWARLLLAQVQADLTRVWRLDHCGGQPPDAGPVQSLLEAPSRRPGELQEAVLDFHQQLLVALTAADFRLGKAYGLGRALAESALLPDAKDPESFRRAFSRYRLANLFFWLTDLKTAFPPHAAQAVLRSLLAWASWVEAPRLLLADDSEDGPSSADGEGHASTPQPRFQISRVTSASWLGKKPRPAKTRALDWGSKRDQESVMRALHRQGQLWRAILSGERDCLSFLSTDDYLRVSDQLLGDIRQLTVRFVRHFWRITTALAVLVVATITAVFVFHAATALIAAVVTTAGAVGITWRGAASSLGRVLQQAQQPLWETELDAAIAVKATQMPRELRSAQRPGDSDRLGQEAGVPTATAPPTTD